MIDDELVRAHRHAALVAGEPDASRLRPESRTFSSRPAKRCNPFYSAAPGHRAEGHGQIRHASSDGSITSSTMWAPPMPSA